MALRFGALPKGFSIPKDAPRDLVIEEDDFLSHPPFFYGKEMITDGETEELFPLFPDKDKSLETTWSVLFTAAPVETLRSGAYTGQGRDLGIADRLRRYGLKVVEVAGWQTRGASTFHPLGSVDHHTAAGRYGNAPSLNICTNGRSDLPGPLCHVLIARDNTCYVIASGRANHAGTGSYAGVAGNSNVYGVEHENTGTGSEPWREDQRKTAATVHAALLDWRRHGFVCQHKEWAPSRKIDKWDQTGPDMRLRVTKVWDARNKKGNDVALFGTHEERIDFVTKSYREVAGREVESAQTRDWWVWMIATDEVNALRLLSGLAKESRVVQDRRLKALEADT